MRPCVADISNCYLVHEVLKKPGFTSASAMSQRSFEIFLDEAIACGYRFVGPEEFLRDRKAEALLLTFDDGLESLYYDVFPLLRKRSIPAVVFIPTSFTGRQVAWDYRSSGRRHLTQEQIDEMVATGLISIGSHSSTHPDLTLVGQTRLIEETGKGSRDPLLYFSYPFGRYNSTVIGAVREAGFTAAFGTANGSPARWRDPLAIPRIPLNRFDNRFSFRIKLMRGRLFWLEILKARIIGMFAPLTYDWLGRP
jgi:peptidoglycan/xylan/chitin deacetylase (PgdA/CDA1 family)